MGSKEEEIQMYEDTYLFAFGKDKSFFYDNDSSVIYSFLRENYWGESLMFRTKLLVTLLSSDASVRPSKIKKELIRKSEELSKYINQNPEQDLPV